ncbi:MAG: tyrosine-protein phosphatase [Clostridia bacterium]|nr:tyrosine-protein phosphatase [Clostridia bacterium]
MKFKKALALLLALVLVFSTLTSVATVSAEVGETYDTFDTLTLSDLGLNPGNFENALAGASHNYTATSASYSVAVKFQWEPHLDGTDKTSWFLTLDFDYNYRAGVWFRGNDIRFCYNSAKTAPYAKLSAISSGRHAVEFGRKLVTSGTNQGKYYVYLTVDNELLASGYTDEYAAADYNSGSGMKNKIYLKGGSFSDQRFADAAAEAPTEENIGCDEISYADLMYNGSPVAQETTMGSRLFTYNRTSSSGSAILKYRWMAKAGSRFQLCFDPIDTPEMSYMFGAQLYVPNADYPNGYVWLRPGYGPKVGLSRAIEDGDVFDVEFARIKMQDGANAGKYYVYIKIGDILFAEDYVSADGIAADGSYSTKPGPVDCNVLSGQIYLTFWGVSGNKITSAPVTETYCAYDEIGYNDLMDDKGNALDENTAYSGGNIFTYNRTSPTGSAILKYRWTVGSVPKFQLSFDYAYESNGTTKAMDYMFGVQVSAPGTDYPNGEVRLRPGYGRRLNLATPFEVENIYDIEFARLKVATGPNKGKYYVYIKVDGVLLDEAYTEANIVDSNNHYITRPGVDGTTEVAISNKIFLAFWGSYSNMLSETWENGKGYYVNYYANGKLVEKVPFTFDNPTVAGKEPTVPAIPNATGVWEEHPTTGLTKGLNVNAVYTVTAPSVTTSTITLNTFNGAEVDLKTDMINEYLGLSMAEQSDFARNFSKSGGYQDHQNISFSWSDLGTNSSYTAYFANNADFDNAFIVTTANKELVNTVGIFTPGKTYYWFVAGNDTGVCSAVDTFTALDTPVRYISAGAVTNVRDEGGYTTADGRTVKYGLVYRGASLDEDHSHVDDMARKVVSYPRMNTEIELRGSYTHTQTGWDNSNKNVCYINAVNYSPILTIDDTQKAQYKATFEAMADESNYPFYFHCSAGADRTGTFGYLLNGLLGVSYENLREDYELTSFSEVGRRPADYRTEDDSFDIMHAALMAQYGDGSGDIALAIENFLTSYIGVETATLDAIKEIMLECNHNGETVTTKENVTAVSYDEVVKCAVCDEEISRKTVATDLIIGTQKKGNSTRLVMKLCADAETIEAYETVGFKIVVDGIEQTVALESVYDSFYNNGSLVTTANLNCTYVAIYEIGNISGASSVTVQGIINGTTFGAVRTLK